MSALIGCAGAAYGLALWLIAAYAARSRSLSLGRCPLWLTPLCGSAAVASVALGPSQGELLVATSLIGAIVCAIVDARTGYIFDALSLTMIAVASAIAARGGRFVDGMIAVAVVGGLLAFLYFVTGRKGIGLGDVKLGSALALGYGLGSALVAIGSAFVLGALYAGAMLSLGRAKRSDSVRFGPFIAGGAAVGLTAGALGWPW